MPPLCSSGPAIACSARRKSNAFRANSLNSLVTSLLIGLGTELSMAVMCIQRGKKFPDSVEQGGTQFRWNARLALYYGSGSFMPFQAFKPSSLTACVKDLSAVIKRGVDSPVRSEHIPFFSE